MLDAGIRDVRNQGVLMRGVNDTSEQLLDLCFGLQDEASITPYYFYMCDMIPFSEHWRVSLRHAQELQHSVMGYLPGFATPRIVCDVPFVGKRWVHQVHDYDTVRGISTWTKNYRTSIESADVDVTSTAYAYYDPIDTLPAEGQTWWRAALRRLTRTTRRRWPSWRRCRTSARVPPSGCSGSASGRLSSSTGAWSRTTVRSTSTARCVPAVPA